MQRGEDRLQRQVRTGCASSAVREEPARGAAPGKGSKGWLKNHVEVVPRLGQQQNSTPAAGERPSVTPQTTPSAWGYYEPGGGVGHAPQGHTPNQRQAAPPRGARPLPLPDNLGTPSLTCACAVARPRLFTLPPGSPAASMAAPCVSCGAAVFYRIFLGGRVSLARRQGVWKAAAAELQIGAGSQVREKWKHGSV